MRAEVISIGDELTSGQRLDTNSQWLSRQLADLGIRVVFHTTVSDDLAANIEVFRRAIERVDVVISTGGLGPTADDLTRDALAAVANAPLVLHEPSLEHIRFLFSQRTRSMPESNRVQAMFPVGAVPIHNPHGTAPGIEMRFETQPGKAAYVFALPGVPGEMKELWELSLVSRLRCLLGSKQLIRHHVIKCFGVGESDLEQRLPDLIRRGRRPSVGITVSHATISLRITAEGEDDAQIQAQIEPTRKIIHECLGDLIFGEGESFELQHAVLRLLRDSRRTLSICEWGTRGLVGQWLLEAMADQPTGAQSGYVGGWQIGDFGAVQKLTGDEKLLSAADADVMLKLAVACRQEFETDLALAIGPWPSAPVTEKPMIQFALATPDRELARSANTAGHPEIRVTRAAKQALNWLRLFLLNRPED